MHLKALELENFKTFAKKTTIPFLKGFTGITGPNGSGKSNIPDAILFVLGPRSPKLIRAGKLTDLIFNGGKKGKPAEYCKVSLVFDNSDHVMPIEAQEVRLTRLVKRARSENNPDGYYSYFYINGKPSSLTEFENLLRFAHISADGYNIVMQGDVMHIVQMTPVERRRILDDVAGITSFDDDLAKAEKERIEVEGNIERINIIMGEIDNQISQLKKDRSDALKYKESVEKLALAKASLAVKMRDEAESQIANIRKQISGYNAEKEKFGKQLAEMKERHGDATLRLHEIEERIAKSRGSAGADLVARIEEHKTKSVTSTERANFYGDEIKRLSGEKEGAEKDIGSIEREIKKYEKESSAAKDAFDLKSRELEARGKELKDIRELAGAASDGAMSIQRDLIHLKQQYEQQSQTAHGMNLEKDRLMEQYNRLKTRIAELEEHIKMFEFELKDAEWQARESRNEISTLKELKEKGEKEIFEKHRKLSEFSRQQNELETAIRRLTNEYEMAKAEAEAKAHVQQGYSRIVNAVMDARNTGKIKGICGTISELGALDEKYSVALSVAAGSRTQSIVVENDGVAAECIEYLKRNRLGRGTFLPLNKMVAGRPRGAAILARQDSKAVGFAIDLIRFNEKYRAAFWYVFGDTVVVDALDTARRLMGGARMVSLDGSLIEASGAMTGGHIERELKGVFGSAAQLGQPGADIELLAAKLREANERHEGLMKSISALNDDMRGLTDALAQATPRLNSESLKVADVEVRHKSAASRLAAARSDYEGERGTFEDVSKKLVQVEQALENTTIGMQRLDAQREEKGKLMLKATSKEISQKIKTLEQATSELEKETNALKSRIDVLQTNIQLTNNRREEFVNKFASVSGQISQFKQQIEDCKRIAAESQSQLDVLMRTQAQLSEQDKKLSDERDRTYNECADLNTKTDKISTKIETYSQMCQDLNLKLPALEQQVEERNQEIKNCGEVALPEKLPTIDELKITITTSEQLISGLGAVNLRAIADYDYQCKRKGELTEQTTRLDEQKTHLLSLVEEIKTKKKDTFMKVFTEVNGNFKQSYSTLAEGEGEIVLDSADDPFAGGLILRAKPKEKRWIRLEALSGGEKSITSMAFIFALQQYQPSPFYLLDEIDQNMDGINSELVAKTIRDRSQTAQFVTISLKKIVLKAADHVYGITNNDGISNIIGEIDIDNIVEQKEAQNEPASGATESKIPT